MFLLVQLVQHFPERLVRLAVLLVLYRLLVLERLVLLEDQSARLHQLDLVRLLVPLRPVRPVRLAARLLLLRLGLLEVQLGLLVQHFPERLVRLAVLLVQYLLLRLEHLADLLDQ